MHEEFVKWFATETAGPKDRYQLPSEEIWKRWQEAVVNARPESQHKVELEIVTSYEPLAKFSRDLKAIVKGRVKEAILENDLLP